MTEQPDTGVDVHSPPAQRPGGPVPGRRRRGRTRADHATIDLQGARRGIIEDQPPSGHDGAAVYSTGPGGVDAYHYHRGEQYEELYATREDMQLRNPEQAPQLKGPGQ